VAADEAAVIAEVAAAAAGNSIMARHNLQDAILVALYSNDYHNDVEMLATALKADRATVVAQLKALCGISYARQAPNTTSYLITHLGIYYLENQHLVTQDQIHRNERLQLNIMKSASATPLDGGVVAATETNNESAAANRDLLITSGLLQADGEALTEDGKKYMKYLSCRYPPPATVGTSAP